MVPGEENSAVSETTPSGKGVLNWEPIRPGSPFGDTYRCKVEDGDLFLIVAREPQQRESGLMVKHWHISMSHRGIDGVARAERLPSWDELKDARYRFVPEEVNMAMMMPPGRLYVNLHETTMHLHEIPMIYAGD